MTEKTMSVVDVRPPGSREPPEELPPFDGAVRLLIKPYLRQESVFG